jgi:hypothetical protein
MRKTPEDTNPAMTLPESTDRVLKSPAPSGQTTKTRPSRGGIPTDLSPSHRRHTRSETGFGTGTCVRRMDGGPRSISA